MDDSSSSIEATISVTNASDSEPEPPKHVYAILSMKAAFHI